MDLAGYTLASVLCRVLHLNLPEIHFVVIGFIVSVISGMVLPAYSIFFGELLEVSQ